MACFRQNIAYLHHGIFWFKISSKNAYVRENSITYGTKNSEQAPRKNFKQIITHRHV